jgi:L-ornithine N5-monooxygenase
VHLTKPKFAILNHSEVLSAETTGTSFVEGSQIRPEPITLILQQTLTRDIYENTYDAIFCATGYERRSWLRLLTTSRLGKYFGLDATAQGSTHLEVAVDLQKDVVESDGSSAFEVADVSHQGNSSDASMSSGSNTPTSLDWEPGWPGEGGEPTKKLYISRAYRLLPTVNYGRGTLEAGIYVQGLAEETHGLSDTLLSVVGVRAGEVVDDLCAHFASNDNIADMSSTAVDVKLSAGDANYETG